MFYLEHGETKKITVNLLKIISHAPNANMADCLVSAWHESHESEASQSLMFCCDNVSPESLALSSIWSALFCRDYELLCYCEHHKKCG